MRVTLGDHRPAEGRERSVHGSGLVAVFSVTDPHFPLIGLLLWILQPSQEIAFALLLDNGAELDVSTRDIFAGFKHLHRAVAARSLIERNQDVVHLVWLGRAIFGVRRTRGQQ